MEQLKEFCRQYKIKFAYDSRVEDGDIIYDSLVRGVIYGDKVDEGHIAVLKSIVEKKDRDAIRASEMYLMDFVVPSGRRMGETIKVYGINTTLYEAAIKQERVTV